MENQINEELVKYIKSKCHVGKYCKHNDGMEVRRGLTPRVLDQLVPCSCLAE